MGAINDAEAFIAEQSAAKRAALAARAKEIKWAISSVYEALWKKKLEGLLEEAVAAMNETCDQREAMFAERIQAARDAWNASVEAESASLAAHTAVKDAECDEAQAEQTAIFAQYVEDALARFDAWAEAAEAVQAGEEEPHPGHGLGQQPRHHLQAVALAVRPDGTRLVHSWSETLYGIRAS